LAERIRHQPERPSSKWSRSLHMLCPEQLKVIADRFCRGYANVRAELPLRLAWTRDTLKEYVERGFTLMLVQGGSDPGRRLRVAAVRAALGLSLAAAIGLLIAVSRLQRQQPLSETHIVINPTLPNTIKSSPEPRLESKDVVSATSPVTHSSASDSLARTDPVSPAELPAGGSSLPVRAAGTATTAATSMPTSSPRYDFDLDHGTPMHPETRGGKPAY
jgi:hypothetical protein